MDLKGSCSMKALTGVFASASDAERAWSQFREIGVAEDRLTLLSAKAYALPSRVRRVPRGQARELVPVGPMHPLEGAPHDAWLALGLFGCGAE